jgi:DNA adenine methylase
MSARQLPLPGLPPPDRVVNVASVKHRSPFRYPGGKTWLVPRARLWLESLPTTRRAELIEPFAGGAIIGLTAAFEGLADRVTLVELDEDVAAVWETIITAGEGAWLAEQITSFDLTPATVDTWLAKADLSRRERAFQTIIKNRVNRGGILAPGAGRLKSGEKGRGLASRWYPETLARRILDLDAIRDRLRFIQGDGLAVMARHANRPDTAFFIDPPYTAAGKKPGRRLYRHADLDHSALFWLAGRLAGDFLMSYQNGDTVRRIAAQHNLACRSVAMKNTHHARQTELLIGRDLGWL